MADEWEEKTTPNIQSNMEPAEGSRENVNLGTGAGNPMERGSGQPSQPEKPMNQPKQPSPERKEQPDRAGGITNRPLNEERENQEELPPRGEAKGGGHVS